MVSRRHLFSLLLFLTAVSLILVACERPTPRADDADSETADTTVDAGSEAVAEDPNVGGGTDGSETAEQPVSTDASEAPTDTQPAEETGETQPAEGETGETAVSDTTDTTETTDTAETTDTTDTAETTETTDTTETAETGGEETTTDAPAEETTTADTTQETGDQPTTHTVAAGENLYRIGLKYGVSWVALAKYNNLPNANRIYVGQVLKLTPPGDSGGEPTPTPSPATETTYIVQPGDNLFRIGLKYGISWVQIAEANGLVNPNIIKVGDTLKIPVSTPGPSPQFTHKVQPGDTLFKISLQYGVPWPNIATANDIPAPYVIYPGQTLQIPGQ